MRTIGVVTVARSDYGIYLPVLRAISTDSDLGLRLLVSGMHLSPEFGLTVRMIEADGFEIAERVEMLLSSDSPEGIAKSMGLGTIGFAQAFGRSRPDILVVLGDRFEMHAAAVAALPFKIPIAHIHGGELTEGAIDEAIRHSITKMSHLHFAATEVYAQRVIQMGEEPWRVVVSGAPSLDHLRAMQIPSRAEIERECGIRVPDSFILVTYHPVTLEYENAGKQVDELLAALDEIGMPTIFTHPNADTRGRLIAHHIDEYVLERPGAQKVIAVGSAMYYGLMKYATAMVGNSSSGIIEAPSLELPVVNIGNRQRGRLRASNVIDVGNDRHEVIEGIRTAVSSGFKCTLVGIQNPYGDGHAAERILAELKEADVDDRLLTKKFFSSKPE